MKRWIFSPLARRDMMGIWQYTKDRWVADQADRYARKIEHDLTAAAAGSPLLRPLGRHLRIKSGHHICVLRRNAEGIVIVVRVLLERMDVEAILGD